MSADLLRQAASKAREVAERSTPGPWQAGEDVDSGERFVYDSHWTELAQVAEWSTGLGNPSHIALWHPAVALAVADWLDSVADACTPPDDIPTAARKHVGRSISHVDETAALAVARLLLGADS